MPGQPTIPVVDLGGESRDASTSARVADEIGRACQEHGFFYVVGHGVDDALGARLERLSRRFFEQDLETKMRIRMDLGGRAWRGYFPVGAELTDGKPDRKEGIYFGTELDAADARVVAGEPLHGPNLFPDVDGFRDTVLEYLERLTRLGHRLMEAMARSLDLAPDFFAAGITRDPLILFRIFSYPPLDASSRQDASWSVGEHTDYGLLTILHQDGSGGLAVKTPRGWIEAPPVPGSFVCNIGDMLDRVTGGVFRSTPHRVLNVSGRARLSFPFFFDPGFDAQVRPLDPAALVREDRDERWDRESVHAFEGTYGDYLLRKVSRVFPQLRRDVL